MTKLIRADLYKSFHRAYLFIFMAAMAVLAIGLNAVLAYSHMPLEASIELIAPLLMYPLFLICMFADVTMAEENKEHTLKNTISFGVPRSQLFLSKIVSTILVAFSVALTTIIVYFASAFILLHPEKADLSAPLTDMALRLGTAMFIYVAAAAMATLLAAVIKRNALFTFAYFGLLFVPVLVFKLLNPVNPIFGRMQSLMLYSQSQIIASVPQAQLLNTVWISLIYLAAFTGIGLVLFRKQEIN